MPRVRAARHGQPVADCEVAIVIGRTCRGVSPAEAGDSIAGYTIGKMAWDMHYLVAGPDEVAAEYGAQPAASQEVISTAFGGDWEFRGIRPPARS